MKLTKLGHVLNWAPDLPDHRDLLFKQLGTTKPTNLLPSSIDLRPFCSPIVNQFNIGSCTGNSLAGHLEFLELKEQRENTPAPEEFDPTTFSSFSRLFIYYNERAIEGDPDQDGGAQIRDGIKALATYGCCKESTWPYDPNSVFTDPATPAYGEALQHKISSYYRLDNTDLASLKQCLYSGFLITFGFSVYDYFESPQMAATGILNVPQPGESCLGGHAVDLVGFSDAEKMFWVRNSWGNWGPFKGYFKMSYDYITNLDLCDDFWTIRK